MLGFWVYAAVFFSAILSAMGVGGGTLLLAILALFSDLSGGEIRFLNLFLFLPVAILALTLHAKKGLLAKDALLFAIPTGIVGAILGSLLSAWLDPSLFRTLFGILLLAVGSKELFCRPKNAKKIKPHPF